MLQEKLNKKLRFLEKHTTWLRCLGFKLTKVRHQSRNSLLHMHGSAQGAKGSLTTETPRVWPTTQKAFHHTTLRIQFPSWHELLSHRNWDKVNVSANFLKPNFHTRRWPPIKTFTVPLFWAMERNTDKSRNRLVLMRYRNDWIMPHAMIYVI